MPCASYVRTRNGWRAWGIRRSWTVKQFDCKIQTSRSKQLFSSILFVWSREEEGSTKYYTKVATEPRPAWRKWA